MFSSLKSKLVNSPEWVIFIGVLLTFSLVNISYTGPTVLNDEIGYLANAALIAGYVIDGAFSYHAGYSFFLAPLFLIFSEPVHIWQAAMILNAFIWAGSFLVLGRILKTILPQLDKRQLFAALLISAMYPAWITMSGYVFTTTAFVFIYLLSVLTFLLWKPDKFWTILPHAAAVGYLYWIHPVGLAVCIASFITVTLVSLREKKYSSLLINFIVIAILIIFYREVVDKWLIMLATPENATPLYRHYPDSENIIRGVFAFDFWLEAVTKAAGQISYLIISSFGFILFGFISSVKKSLQLKSDNKGSALITNSLYLYLALSLMGVIATGVMYFSLGNSTRIDQWIYGRYAEMVVLPLLALGYLSFWNKKVLLIAAVFTIAAGLLLNQIVDLEIINLSINISAFWPQNMILVNNYFYWMSAGAMIMAFLGLIRYHSKWGNKSGVAIVVMVFILSTVIQGLNHNYRISAYGTPSEFVEVIRDNYPPGTCVGVGPKEIGHIRGDLQTQRYNLHLFHLYDYKYRRMAPEEWLNSCNGPYLTFDLDEIADEQAAARLVDLELNYSFHMLIKNDEADINIPDSTNSVRFID